MVERKRDQRSRILKLGRERSRKTSFRKEADTDWGGEIAEMGNNHMTPITRNRGGGEIGTPPLRVSRTKKKTVGHGLTGPN